MKKLGEDGWGSTCSRVQHPRVLGWCQQTVELKGVCAVL